MGIACDIGVGAWLSSKGGLEASLLSHVWLAISTKTFITPAKYGIVWIPLDKSLQVLDTALPMHLSDRGLIWKILARALGFPVGTAARGSVMISRPISTVRCATLRVPRALMTPLTVASYSVVVAAGVLGLEAW